MVAREFGQRLWRQGRLISYTDKSPIPPQHKNWFARVTAKQILWVPASSQIACALLFLLSGGTALGPILSMICVLTTAFLTSISVACKNRLKGERSSGHYRALERLKQIGVVSGVFWGAILGSAFVLNGTSHLAELSLLCVLLMLLGAAKYVSTPIVGAVHILSILLGSCAGLLVVGARTATVSAFILMLMGGTFYALIKSLNYNFVTRKLRSRALEEANETVEILLREFDEQGSDWLWEVDLEGLIVRPSARFHAAAEREISALARHPLIDLFGDGPDRDLLADRIREPEPFRRLVVSFTANGEQRWWSLSGRPSVNRYGEVIGLRGVATDVSQSKRAEAKIAHMAHYDGLTDLPNRALFSDTLKWTLERRRPEQLVSVLYLDLDRFKMINDTMGHDVGDFVLQVTAQRIAKCIGAGDMVARLGGDEFAIVVTSLQARGDVVDMALRIIDALAEPILLEGQQINSGTSIGIAFADSTDPNPQEMLKNADLALYDAKSRGGHIALVFLPQMYQAMLTRRLTESDLGSAILKNELELYYQPLVSIETNETMAYEALLRWNHPTRGQIQPSIFIPIAEETGLIVQIGEWVIRSALRELATWPEHLSVSVNLSPVQMRSPNIIPTIVNALASSGVSPSRVEIEITESVLMNDSEANLALLHKLKGLGLRVSLDDFGTGYSSLNYLRSFPFDKIKIDRCFVEEIAERKDCQAIIQAVVALATSLNMTTTAEGIENEGQLTRLKADGCDQAQGYFFSRPTPADQLGHKLLASEAHVKAA